MKEEKRMLRGMTLMDIAKACSGELVCTEEMKDSSICGVTLDSRKVEEGFLFIAAKGERVDGHSFIGEAFDRGAVCVIGESPPEDSQGAYILVKDSFRALKDIAEFYRKQLNVTVIGITGSVGKTSTKEFIAGVLGQRFCVLKTLGNFNNEVGLPLTIMGIREEHQVAVLEMGISDFGEMHRLSKMARPDICVITNIGQCHLEQLKTREGILQAKTEIFDYMSDDGDVFINGDDDILQRIEKVKNKKPVTFGKSEQNDYFAMNIENKGLLGCSCIICDREGTFPVNIPLPGEHMVLNALVATAIGKRMGLTEEEIEQGIGSVKSLGGRSNIIQREDYIVIDDCYNANPVSVKAAIDLLATAAARKVAVLGDMLDLGTDSERLHTEVGAYAVEKGIDCLLCVGGKGACLYEGAKRSLTIEHEMPRSMELHYFATREALLQDLPGLIKKQDTILVKASHGMGFDKVVQALMR